MKTFKQLATTFVALILFTSASAQSTLVEGIGIFKLGKTAAEILPLADKQFGKAKKTKYGEVDLKEGSYGEISSRSDCSYTHVYYVPQYKLAAVTVKGLYVTFYKDTLISLKADGSPDIARILESKYGKPTERTTQTEFTCHTSLGSSFTLPETSHYQEWGTETDHVYAYVCTYDTHDYSTCVQGFSSMLYIYMPAESKEETLCGRQARENGDKAKQDELKKKSSDF